MKEGRRMFFGKALGGLGALAGLLLPSKAWAWGRRRGCSSVVVSEYPGTGHVVEENLGKSSPSPRSPVSLNFPTPSDPIVYGGGGFYAWGYANNVPITRAVVTGAGGVNVPGAVISPPPMTFTPLPLNWTVFAFRFDKVPTNTAQTLTLTVYYKDSNGIEQTGDTAIFKCN